MQAASFDTQAVAFNQRTGAARMALLDAHNAVRAHPNEWSFAPWVGDSEDRPPGASVFLPADWRDLAPSVRRGFAAQLDRTYAAADKPQADADALVARAVAERVEVAA